MLITQTVAKLTIQDTCDFVLYLSKNQLKVIVQALKQSEDNSLEGYNLVQSLKKVLDVPLYNED